MPQNVAVLHHYCSQIVLLIISICMTIKPGALKQGHQYCAAKNSMSFIRDKMKQLANNFLWSVYIGKERKKSCIYSLFMCNDVSYTKWRPQATVWSPELEACGNPA